ncbi:hypothetical protein B0H13DRAFT_2319240 [Mycena leptocephala]|nr:hypothetical protein B0H13DRAFT_2319240 [Mycena leptocephala]
MSLKEAAAELGLTGPYPELRLRLWGTTQILSPFLCSPENSPICAATVVKLTRKVLPWDADAKHCFPLLRTEHRACLDAFVRFVAVPRTDEQLRGLEIRLNDCRCDLTAYKVLQLVHDADNHLENLSFNGMISSIFKFLGRVVLHGLKVGHVVGQSAAGHDSMTRKWPANTAALFPAGPDAAVISFARLFRLTKSSAILDFIRSILPHCPSVAMSISSSALFWEVTVEGLQVAVDNFDPSLVGDDQGSDTDNSKPHDIIRAFTMFLQIFIPTFTESLRQKITSSSTLASCGRKIHDLLVKVLTIVKGSPNQDKLEALGLIVASMAGCVVKAVPEHQRPRRIHPFIVAYATLRSQPKAWAFTQVFGVLSRLTAVAQCCNAVCTETSESSAQRLRYCARCRVMRYCCSTCQRTAWKYHKTVCADVEKLNKKVMPKFCNARPIDKGNPGQCLVEFEREAQKLGFTEDRMKEISRELTPFCHFRNAGMMAAPTHEDVDHC